MAELRELTLLEAIKEAYREEMQRDDNVYLLGISIQAGTFPHTTGLCEEFGSSRVVDAPLAESGMIGCAFGSALEGMRPVVDFMYAGFAYYCGSEVFLQAGHFHFMHGSAFPGADDHGGCLRPGPPGGQRARHSPIRRAHPSSRHQGVHAFDPL